MSQAKATIDQRRQQRLEIEDALIVTDTETNTALGQLANMSVSGLMLSSTQPITTDKTFRLRIPLSAEGVDDACITVSAESLWCDDINGSGSYWTGFHISEISPEDQAILDKLVEV